MKTTQRRYLTPTAWAHVSKGLEGRQQLTRLHRAAAWPGLVNSIECKLHDSVPLSWMTAPESSYRVTGRCHKTVVAGL